MFQLLLQVLHEIKQAGKTFCYTFWNSPTITGMQTNESTGWKQPFLVPETLLKFCILIIDIKIEKIPRGSLFLVSAYFNHFHKLHFNCQDLYCRLHVQQLKQVQQNYTLKDNLSYPFDLWWLDHSLMIGSFSISSCNFFTSLILSTWEISFKYRPLTCLRRAFSVFSDISFSSRCLCSAYALLMV